MEKEKIKKEIAEINKAVGSGEVFNKFAKNDPRFDKYDFQDPQGWAEKEVLKREKMLKDIEDKGKKQKIDSLKKEIAEINKAVGSGEVFNKFAKNDPRFDKYDFQDPQGWAEKEVLKREEMIRKLEGSKKVIDEKKQKIKTAEENKTFNRKERPKSTHDEVLSDEDLELRKKEIYQEGDDYVEEHVGTGQFEYRKTPESKKENDQDNGEKLIKQEDKKDEATESKGGKNPDDLGNVGLNVDKGAYDTWNDVNEDKKKGENLNSKRNKPKSAHDEVLSDEDLELRKKEIYQEGDDYVEEHVGTGQFEYRKTPESKKKDPEDPDKPFYPPVVKDPEDPDKPFYPPVVRDPEDPEQPFYPPEPVTPRPIVPQPDPTIKEKKKLNIISVDEIVKSYAWRMAEEKVREFLHDPESEMDSGNSRMRSLLNNITAPFRHPVRFGKKMWVRMAEQGYLYKFYQESLAEITSNQNLMQEFEASWRMGRPMRSTDAELKRDSHYEVLDKIISEYSNNVAEAEEQGFEVNNIDVNNELNSLITRFYLEGWDRKRFEEEQRVVINDLKSRGLISDNDFLGNSGRSTEEVEDGAMYASNLYQIAEDYRNDVEKKINEIAGGNELNEEQKEKIKDHVMSTIKLDISLGSKLGDLNNRRPQGTFNNFDRVFSGMQRIPILGKIASNPATIAILFSVGAGFGTRTLMRGATTAGIVGAGVATGPVAAILAAGVATGLYGGFRKNMELKKDRAMHQRQRTLGKEFGDYRRERMEEFQYDIASTEELMNQLENIENVGNFENLSSEQKLELASMFARFKVELVRTMDHRQGQGNRTADLISVSKEEGDQYGTNVISKTDLKIKLYEYLRNNNLITEEQSALANNSEFNDLFNSEVQRLDDNINNLDSEFDSYRRIQSSIMGAAMGLAGAATAIGVQHLMEHSVGNGNKNTAWDFLTGNNSEYIDGKTIQEETGRMIPKNFDNFKDFFKNLYGDYNPDQRVSYQGFNYQGTAPEEGIRALPESLKNLINNLKLNANYTELMMQYKQDSNGDVIVDASRMIKETIKEGAGDAGQAFSRLLEDGKVKMALSLENASNMESSQFNPILLEMDESGKIRIPEKIAKIFFGFDEEGKLLGKPGDHPGLHSLIFDTGLRRERDGAMIVEQIASTLGEKPDMIGEVPEIIERKIPPVEPESTDWMVGGPTGASRWQLENERSKENQDDIIDFSDLEEEPIELTDLSDNELAGDEAELNRIWERFRGDFDNNLKTIIKHKLNEKAANNIVEVIDSFLRGSKNGLSVDIERSQLKNYFDNFKKIFPESGLNLISFSHCLKNELNEYIDNLKNTSSIDKDKAKADEVRNRLNNI